ncbi:TetR/AcrR family transcriptional regulator [Pseudonocardia aurantiaca]
MSTPRRRRRGTGHELRTVVVRVATDLLASTGDVDTMTMRDVASAAGVTTPSVYRHFPDKEALVREVLAERFAEFTNLLQDAAAAAGDEPLARLAAMAAAYVRAGLAEPGHYRVMFSATNSGWGGLGLDPADPHPGAAAHQALVDATTACLPPSTHAEAPLLATELWASLHGLVDLQITKPDMPWPDPDRLIDLALTAVRRARMLR